MYCIHPELKIDNCRSGPGKGPLREQGEYQKRTGEPELAASYPTIAAHFLTTTLLPGSASCCLDSALHQWPAVDFLVLLRNWVGHRDSAVVAKLLLPKIRRIFLGFTQK